MHGHEVLSRICSLWSCVFVTGYTLVKIYARKMLAVVSKRT